MAGEWIGGWMGEDELDGLGMEFVGVSFQLLRGVCLCVRVGAGDWIFAHAPLSSLDIDQQRKAGARNERLEDNTRGENSTFAAKEIRT